ncbi:neuraminidase-like domain-containing protein, partial [Xenorhabdus szentirmaii]|uniref:neuraminidase-like domain-containing protein n=1 Tax=Xenorhabdus szentirmaii TaxID=290112 RepID=UPI002B417C9C
MQDADGKTSLSPTAWSEWQEVQLSTGEIINPKIIWINNRVHVVYFTKKSEQAMDGTDPSDATSTYVLEIIYQKLNNTWSTPVILATYPDWPAIELKLSAIAVFGSTNTEDKNNSFDVMYELDDRPHQYVRKVLTLDSRLQSIKERDLTGTDEIKYAKFYQSKMNVCDSAYYGANNLIFPDIIQENGGEYLALRDQKLPDLTHIRLNTTFAAQLVGRASLSLDNLFSWEAQNTPEVAPPSNAVGVPNTLDFHGTNGRYFWEIFFHIPHAVANRLHQEFSYRDAENWYHYIFNPQIRVHEGEDNANKTPYWRVCPLLEPGSYTWEQEAGRVADPDAICYSTPERYKKTIFMEYARNILAQGDALYRRLTRDALTEARIHYARVTELLGPRPDVLVASRWTPKALEALSTDATVLDGSLARFLPEMLPKVSKVRNGHWKVLDDPKVFRTPINPDLIALWDTLQQRLDTLHNNLTIDGKPMLLEMYAAPVNPRDLLRAQSSASGLSQRAVSALAPILPYRFRALLPRVQNAVETLTRFGDLVRQYREQKEQALQEERVQSQMDELSAFAVQLQEVALAQQQAAIDTLISSKKVVTDRQAYYRQPKDDDISSSERDSMDKRKETIPYEQASAGMESAASIADLVPNLFGTRQCPL